MEKQTVYVISGVAGMTGSELARQLLKKDNNCVIGFDNFFASQKKNINDLLTNYNFHFFEYDLNNENHMFAFEKYLFEHLELIQFKYEKLIFVNCAAVVHTEHFYEIDSTFETNVLGMKKFLDFAIKFNADIFINCSSSEVYSMGSWSEDGVKESDYLSLSTAEHSQRTSYATGKLITEFFMKDAVNKGLIKGCSLRFANVYSNDEASSKHIIPYIISSFERGNNLILLENAKDTMRTFLHNFDSCSAIIALCETEDALDGSVYNVGTQDEFNIVQLAKLIAIMMKIDNPNITFKGKRESDPKRRLLNTDKIYNATKWRPFVRIADGIEMILKNRGYEKK